MPPAYVANPTTSVSCEDKKCSVEIYNSLSDGKDSFIFFWKENFNAQNNKRCKIKKITKYK